MYSRKNVHPDMPGAWISEDGEFEFRHEGPVWVARYRAILDDRNAIIGASPTLAGAFALAGRYYMTPVGHWTVEGIRLDYQCAGCGAMLQRGHNIVNVTPERTYHCDGCAQPGDTPIEAVS